MNDLETYGYGPVANEFALENETDAEGNQVFEPMPEPEPETVLETEPETVMETEIETESEIEVVNDVMPLAAYDGSFGSTYVEYFRGFVSKLSPGTHYLCYRDGQYSYVLYYGADLKVSGGRVIGSADYYRLNTYNGYALTTGTSQVNEYYMTGMYYSDLPGAPSLLGGDYYVQAAILFVLCIIFICTMLHYMYRLARRVRRRRGDTHQA